MHSGKKLSSWKWTATLISRSQKTIDNGSAEEMSTTTNLMEIIIPYDMTGKSNITVYRNHGGSTTAFRQLSTRPISGAAPAAR